MLEEKSEATPEATSLILDDLLLVALAKVETFSRKLERLFVCLFSSTSGCGSNPSHHRVMSVNSSNIVRKTSLLLAYWKYIVAFHYV
jgi:hypothetical protein